MKKSFSALLYGCAVLVIAFGSAMQPASLHAQSRLNDKDIEALMRNLREDSKSFRDNFDSALKKSDIRKTSQEKDAKSLISSFQQQTDSMLSDFKKTRRGDVAIENTLNSAQEIQRLIYNLQLDSRTISQWEKVRAELERVSNAFGIQAPYGHM